MKVTIELNLKPFQTPNFVLIESEPKPRQDGFQVSNSIPLSEIDPGALEGLCEEFTREVFKKAGKQRPPQSITK